MGMTYLQVWGLWSVGPGRYWQDHLHVCQVAGRSVAEGNRWDVMASIFPPGPIGRRCCVKWSSAGFGRTESWRQLGRAPMWCLCQPGRNYFFCPCQLINSFSGELASVISIAFLCLFQLLLPQTQCLTINAMSSACSIHHLFLFGAESVRAKKKIQTSKKCFSYACHINAILRFGLNTFIWLCFPLDATWSFL